MTNIWASLRSLVETYVFGGDLSSVGEWGTLIADLVATCGTLFVIALPFVVVLKIIKMICG